MKKIAALTLAALLMLSCVPAFAFTGFVTDPGMPAVTVVEDAVFNVDVKRVENDPVITEDQWGDEVYEWTYMDNETPIAAGDTVTVACEIQVPAELPYPERMLEQMEVLFDFAGLEDPELVMAYGCDANYECDYEHGYCYPLPGYGNAAMSGAALVVEPHLGGNIKVIVRGTAAAENIDCNITATVGQYRLPCHFSCGKLEKNGDTYYVHYKDTFMVQDRGMKFIAENDHIADYLVCLNNHDYHRVLDSNGNYKYVDIADGHEETDGVKYEALELAYNTYMGFFGFIADNNADYLGASVFLYGSEPVRFTDCVKLGSNEPEPTEPAPTEPEPTEPAVDPTEPAEPTPPSTGAMSLACLGVAAIFSGAGVIALRKKED